MKVLVTNCTVNSSLNVMRSLHNDGVEVIGADSRRLPFGLHSRVSPPYEYVEPEESDDFLKRLIEIIDHHSPDVYLPMGPISACISAADAIVARTNMLVPDEGSYQALNDKQSIVEQCSKYGIQTPLLMSIEEAESALEGGDVEAVIVKPRQNFGGGEGVNIVTTADALRGLARDYERRYGNVLISHFVPGPDDGNVAIQVLFDRESRLISHFALQKTRLQPARVGISASAVSIHRPDLVELILPMFAGLRWRGPADVEFKIDGATGEPWLIEINGRYSGAVGFAIACGVKLPLLTCKAAMGEKLTETTEPAYVAGVKYWNPIMYTRAIAGAVRRGSSLSELPSGIYGELRGKRVGNPYRISDPAPMIGKALFQIRERFMKRDSA